MSDDPTRADPRPVRERLDEVIDALDTVGATYGLCAFARPVRLVSVEALVVLKLQAFADNRDAPEGGQHRADAARLLKECQANIDAIRGFRGGHPLLADLEDLVAAPPPRGRR